MNCDIATKRMHDYLDGDLARDEAIKMKEHMLACPACRARFQQLETTEAYIHTTLSSDIRKSGGSGGYVSADLTARIMKALPQEHKPSIWTRWVRNHPAVTVAAVFALVMMSSFLAAWEQNEELVVRGTDLAEVVIEGDTVTIPADAHIDGDLTVENGKTEVYGEIKGNLTVIDGTLNLASTARILGEERTINQAFDWIWYKLTSTVHELAS